MSTSDTETDTLQAGKENKMEDKKVIFEVFNNGETFIIETHKNFKHFKSEGHRDDLLITMDNLATTVNDQGYECYFVMV